MKPLLAAIFLLTLASCQGTNRSAASGDEEKFARVYATLVIVSSDPQAASGTTPEQILAEAGMTQEEFRKTVADFNRDPQRWVSLIEKVQKIVEEKIPRGPAAGPGDSTGGQGIRQPSQ